MGVVIIQKIFLNGFNKSYNYCKILIKEGINLPLNFKNVYVSKSNGKGKNVEIIKNLSVDINDQDIFAIAGPSGSGKSTLLRLFNRLDDATRGEIIIDNKEIKSWDIKQLREKIGFVFQESALFEGTVLDNIMYGLRIRGIKKDMEIAEGERLLNTVGLSTEYLDTNIDKLSGGQKQRVNIARTLALNPEVLLLDEPTSALDPQGTKQIEELLLELNSKYNKTIVIVSHNIEQIKRIAKRVLVLGIRETKFYGEKEELFESTELDVTAFLEGGRS